MNGAFKRAGGSLGFSPGGMTDATPGEFNSTGKLLDFISQHHGQCSLADLTDQAEHLNS